jgi:MFS family permease
MDKIISRIFPFSHIRNVAMFYVLSGVYNAWIIAGVWIFIWGAFMTKTQIGISDSITFTIGFLFELPSGVIADLMGRRKAIILGNILLTLGNLLVGISSSFVSITVWYLVWTIGYAFQSGATEALAYDTLKQKGLENKWDQVISVSTVIGRISSLTSTAIGGMLFVMGFRLPYMVATAIGLIGVIAAFYLVEIKAKKVDSYWSVELYVNQIKDGLRTLLKPNVLPIAILALTIISIGYMYNWGILRPLTGERFGFSPTTYSYLLSITSLSVIMTLAPMRNMLKKISRPVSIFVLSFFYAIIFLITGFSHELIIGGILMIALSIGLTNIEIVFSQFINEHTRAEHRATTLSAVALFTKMPYIFLALYVGRIAETNGLPQFTIIVGTIALLVSILSLILAKRRQLAI